MYIEIPNSSSVQIISPTFGVIRNEPLEEATGGGRDDGHDHLRTYESRPATRP